MKLCDHIIETMSRERKVPLLGRVPPASSQAVRHAMKGNRGKNTRPELALRHALREAGLKGYRVDWKKAPGSPDIAYVRHRLAIFVHGCFWHSCPHCQIKPPRTNAEYWQRKFIRNRERDARKVRDLEAAGWRVVQLWECEINNDVQSCIDRIIETLSVKAPSLATGFTSI
jgi:DNA mismatch endonuclease, patch repair protein